MSNKPYHIERYMEKVANMGCIICRQPAQIHHWRQNASRRNDIFIIPLCPGHHNEYHDVIGAKTWEMKYGEQRELFAKVLNNILRSKQ